MPQRLLLLTLIACLLAALIPAPERSAAQDDRDHGDWLAYIAYTTHDPNVPLTIQLYDAHSGEHRPAVENVARAGFAISAEGRLAYGIEDTDFNIDLYAVDAFALDAPPQRITATPGLREYPLAWSPDGAWLIYRAAAMDAPYHNTLWAWDGAQSIEITPALPPDVPLRQAGFYTIAWSADGRLALEINWPRDDAMHEAEVYVWDGASTFNVSQHPTGRDVAPAWGQNGQLAWLSERDGVYDLLVWDGVSMLGGQPNPASYQRIAPGLTGITSSPAWTLDGRLAFSGTGPDDGGQPQIYAWDGQQLVNLTRRPGQRHSRARWHASGLWSAPMQTPDGWHVVVRNAENEVVFEAPGFRSIWSAGGYLAVCTQDERWNWQLSVWHGQQEGQRATTAVHSLEIVAQWMGNAEQLYCISG